MTNFGFHVLQAPGRAVGVAFEAVHLSAVQVLGPEPQQLRLGAGFHYCKTLLSRIQMMLKLETDPSEILNELIYSCRKVLPTICCACCVFTKLYCADLCVHCHQWAVRVHSKMHRGHDVNQRLTVKCLLTGWPHFCCGRVFGLHQWAQHWCAHSMSSSIH